jgi:glycosyltransferase involved in cell wall biosynthesis
MRARDRAQGRKTVLVVDHKMPEPDRDAGSNAIMGCLRALLDAGLAVKFWPHNMCYVPGYTEALQDMGVEVFHGPAHEAFDSWMHKNGADLDYVILSRPDVAEVFLPGVRQHSEARVIYYGHDLHFSRLSRGAAEMQARERAIWRAVDVSVYLSNEEVLAAAVLEPGADIRAVVPYAFTRFGRPRPAPACADILFVAGFGHPPNEDAACWFVTEVLPAIRDRVPAARLSIVGSHPSARVRALAGPHVVVTGAVSDDDLRCRYATARVAAVPLRVGAGVKLKVVEALVEGLPLVTTPVGTQGLAGLGEAASIADNAADFADAVVALLTDDALWDMRAASGIAYASSRYRPAQLRESLLDAMAVRLPEASALHAA